MSKVQIEVVTYEQDRLNYFTDLVQKAQKRYNRLSKAFIREPVLSDAAQAISDAGREVQFLADVLEMLDKGYRKQSENVIELPCKIGDVVYIIDDSEEGFGEPYVLGVRVLNFFINENGIALDLQMPLGLRLNTWAAIGKNVFLTREEAEAKMKGGAE